jgi:hypothetical protein
METKVQIDNKSRIRKGLDPIHPAIQKIDFSLEHLTDAEREWVANHYDQDGNTVYIRKENRGTDIILFTVERTNGDDVIQAIQAACASSSQQAKAKKAAKKGR